MPTSRNAFARSTASIRSATIFRVHRRHYLLCAAFCHDLARLELTISQVFDAGDAAVVPPASLPLPPMTGAGAAPGRFLDQAPLQRKRLSPKSVRDQSRPRPAAAKNSLCHICRRDYRVAIG